MQAKSCKANGDNFERVKERQYGNQDFSFGSRGLVNLCEVPEISLAMLSDTASEYPGSELKFMVLLHPDILRADDKMRIKASWKEQSPNAGDQFMNELVGNTGDFMQLFNTCKAIPYAIMKKA